MQRPLMTRTERAAFVSYELAPLEEEFAAWQQATFRFAAQLARADAIELALVPNTAVNVAEVLLEHAYQCMREEAMELLMQPKAEMPHSRQTLGCDRAQGGK